MQRHFDPFPLLRVGVLLLGLLSSPTVHAAAARTASVQSQIAEANRLYEDLEYGQALERIQEAWKASPTEDERITLQLYEGIFLCEMGRLEKGGAVFESALRASPTAQLPIRVPPKVNRLFESLRTKVADEQAAQAQARADAPVNPSLTPTVEAAPPPLELPTSAPREPRPLTQRWYFWAGVGVAAAAVTVGGIVWATSSSFNPSTLCGGTCDVVIGRPPSARGVSF